MTHALRFQVITLPNAPWDEVLSRFKYVEDGTYDKATKTYRFKVTPSSMADKLTNEGTIRMEPAGEGKSRRPLSKEGPFYGREDSTRTH